MIDVLCQVVIVLAALYLVALGVAALAAPVPAGRFLLGFAGSRRVHFLELILRLAVGTAFVLYAPHLPVPEGFGVFGWLLVGTSLGLLLVPWRWHQRFARRVVPHANRHMGVIGVVSVLLGSGILAALLSGHVA